MVLFDRLVYLFQFALFKGSLDKTVKLWGVVSGEMIHTMDLDNAVHYVRFCSNDTRLLVSCANRHVYVMDFGSDMDIRRIQHIMVGQMSNEDL